MLWVGCRVALSPRGLAGVCVRLGAPLSPARPPHRAPPPLGLRTLYSESGVWEREYRAETRRSVEQWWRPRIKEQWRRLTQQQEEEEPGAGGLGAWGGHTEEEEEEEEEAGGLPAGGLGARRSRSRRRR
ncbi:hypothetical protein AAFF_G00183960 [Aldrovandia affinis]|uniref:Uncharacterized protein n=1 Tax=Aldrovandia affinis TaxID=143900 RepID=A0AAD7RK84_9TELE|nr:hypothetical protein AAFF_G00183960 [Aldrovandia affinis]